MNPLLLWVGCSGRGAPPTEPTPEVSLGPVVTCADPVEGFARFEPSAADRGAALAANLDTDEGACPYIRHGLVTTDLDGDGDLDIVRHETDGALTALVNVSGGFAVETLTSPTVRDVYATSAVDLDGDGLPELTVAGQDLALVSWNLGDRTFSDWEVIFQQDAFPRRCHVSMSWGDVDGDGDLDLALPGADQADSEDAVMPDGIDVWTATPDRLIRNDGDGWTNLGDYGAQPDTFSLVHAFTDRDGDCDMDWWVGTDRKLTPDRYGTTVFYRNDGVEDGLPILVDDAPEVGMDTWAAAMGMAVLDLDRDGTLDYCISDFANQLRCFQNQSGVYVDTGQALGLTVDLGGYSYTPDDWPPPYGIPESWVSWALVADDLDNDGYDDMVATASTTPDAGNVLYGTVHDFQPNAIWQGGPDGFTEWSEQTGFGEASSPYDGSMVAADLDGDGTRELLVSSHSEPLEIWNNPCSDRGWLEVELVGLAGNRQAYGARVEVESGGTTQLREVHNLLMVNQGPAALHFGLGDHGVDRLRVTFPDGAVVERGEFAANRHVRIRHPDLD